MCMYGDVYDAVGEKEEIVDKNDHNCFIRKAICINTPISS